MLFQAATVPYEPLALALAAALGTAVVVERIVEGAKNVLDLTRLRSPKRQLNPPAEVEAPVQHLIGVLKEADQRNADEEAVEKTRPPGKPAPPTGDKTVFEWDERLPPSTIVIQGATDPDKGSALRAFLIQALATATGIVAARIADLSLFRTLLGPDVIGPAGDYLLTGLFIGGGSAPAHVLISFINERRVAVAAKQEAPPVPPPAAPGTTAAPSGDGPVAQVARVSAEATVTPEQWVDLPYTGGIDRDLLEGIHHRPDDPNLIVYHHTAMHRASNMDDLVRVIKDRKDQNGHHWVTGYHCAILADGSVHPFCRWDRYGCHAAGYNRRSLGITFMGNFETDPAVPFSNADGRYGPPHPSEAQLQAGARVVTLWTFLYGLEVDFERVIIPHKQIANPPKPCPGGNFPYGDFQKIVRYLRKSWAESPETRERIRAFAAQPYIYVDLKHPKLRMAAT
jgi:hypothetical protein